MISASELGTRIAPAAPWSIRATISTSAVGASAQSSEVTPKPIRPIVMLRARPIRSASEPATRISAPRVIR